MFKMRSCPHNNLVGLDFRITAFFECMGEITVQVEPGLVREAVDPCLRVWLGAFDGADVVRFAIV